MAREFAFETVGTAAFPGLPTTTDPFDYTDTMYNLLENEDYKVGEYPDTMFWGGVDRIDAPYMYPACITFDYESNALSIGALQGNNLDGVNKTDVQLSYAYTVKNTSDYGDFMAKVNNWTVEVNENDENLLSWDFYKDTYTGISDEAGNSRFVSKIALNRRIIIPYIWFCPKIAWNAAISGSPSAPDTVLDLCSCTDWESGSVSYTNRETGVTSTVNTSDCIICGIKIMQCGAIRDFGETGGIRMLGRPSDRFRSIYDATKVMNPINSLFCTYNHDAVLDYDNFHYFNVRIPTPDALGDVAQYPYTIGGEADWMSKEFYLRGYNRNIYMGNIGGYWNSYMWLPTSKHAAAPMIYNGTQTFDISEIMAENSQGIYRRAYQEGDRYLICYKSLRATYRVRQRNTEIYIRPVYQSIDDVYKFIAGLGMAFMIGSTYTSSTTVEKTILDNSIFAPILDEHNVYHGQYTRGAENADNNFFDKSDSTDTDYVPREPEPESNDRSDGDENLPNRGFVVGSTDGFITMYAMTAYQLSQLSDKLWASFTSAAFWESVAVAMYNDFSIDPAHILDYVVSLRMYPLDLKDLNDATVLSHDWLYFGRGAYPLELDSGQTLYTLGSYSETFDGGIVEVPRWHNDFRDYEPFTRIILTVPFCGSVELTPSEVVGFYLRISYMCDFSTGVLQATCWVQSEVPHIVATLSGTIGATVQMSASSNMEFLQKMATAVVPVATAAFAGSTGAAGMLMGAGSISAASAGEVVSSAEMANASKRGFDLSSEMVGTISAPDVSSSPVHVYGMSAGFSSMQITKAFISVQRRYYEIPGNYYRVYGRACNYSTTLENVSGFTVCKNVEVDTLKCTVDEQIRIKQLLETGVFL